MEKSSLFSSEKHTISSHPNIGNNQPIKAKNISILVLVISLPILYVSFLHIPPSTLYRDTTFWFLMSNSIIICIAVDMGTLFAPSPETCEKKLYEDFVTYSKPQSMYFTEEPPKTIDKPLVVKEKLIDDCTSSMNEIKPSSFCPKENGVKDAYRAAVTSSKEVNNALALVKNSNRKKVLKEKSLDPKKLNERSLVATEKPLHRSVTQEKRSCCNKSSDSHDYEMLSDEELNRRVEEFIRRYYREMRLQSNNESV